MPTVTSAASSGRVVGNQPSLTYLHTSNSDPLFVLVEGWNISSTIAATYGGVPLVRAGLLGAGSKNVAVFFHPAPTPGAANIVVTPAPWITSGAFNVSGADLDGPVKNFAIAGGNSAAPPSLNVTSAVGDLVVAICGVYQTNVAFTVGAGQTTLWDQSGIAAADGDRSAGSWEPGAAGAVAMSWTIAPGTDWTIGGFSIPADGTVTNTARLSKTLVEVLQSQSVSPTARLSKTLVEVLQRQSVSPTARLSKTLVEVLIRPTAHEGVGGETVQVVWQ